MDVDSSQARAKARHQNRFPLCSIAFAVFLLVACGPKPGPDSVNETTPPDENSRRQRAFLRAIENQQEWDALAFRPEDQGIARTEALKFLVHLEDGALYFLNNENYSLHYFFARSALDYRDGHEQFNRTQYRSDERDFALGSIVHYRDGDHWTFELVAGDTMSAELLHETFNKVQAVFFRELAFRSLSPLHDTRIQELAGAIPVIDTREVFGDTRFQALVPGEAAGYLRVVDGPLDVTTVRPNQILVVDHVPMDLPPVAGLITGVLQTPLAHVAVLSRNRGTPDMALIGATDTFRDRDGHLVSLTLTLQDYTLEPITEEQAAQNWNHQRPRTAFAPQANLRTEDLLPVEALRDADVVTAGAKASQLGELTRIDGVDSARGFVVPFAHYAAHLLRADASELINEADAADSQERRSEILAEVRSRIESTPVSRRLLRQILGRTQGAESGRWIFRSSTNAEDLPGFNGAGLYESVVLDEPSHEEAGLVAIEVALKEVWASTWLARAFEERRWFRIQQRNVQMAVLIQPLVARVVATGVAFTKNPFTLTQPGVYLNVQTTAGSVTGAEEELPEELLVYTWTPSYEMHVLRRSSLVEGPIFTPELAAQAAYVLEQIHEARVPSYDQERANAVDVEFVLTEDARFVVVQARPIFLEYSEAQDYPR